MVYLTKENASEFTVDDVRKMYEDLKAHLCLKVIGIIIGQRLKRSLIW